MGLYIMAYILDTKKNIETDNKLYKVNFININVVK